MSSDRDRQETLSQTSASSSEQTDKQFKAIAKIGQNNPLPRLWDSTTRKLQKLIPWENIASNATKWFGVDDERVATILKEIKKELPTTEAWLIGKPQAGKSSIVRGLTGVSDEIIGQGFQPHTQHTERYAYPSNELPLLIFTDTVGLGDIERETQTIIAELETELEKVAKRARILILTVKINDFATDSLRQTARQLKQKYPHIPCLLAITCLHEIYPLETDNHPDYPPNYAEIKRAREEIEVSFAGLYDRSVLIDFTLEEDEYEPVFYGLASLRDNLAELLPQAEANTIHQLLDREIANEIGNIYRDTARRYLVAFSTMAATLAAVPLPFATMPVLTALQVSMVGLLGKLYGQTLNPSQAGGIVSAIAGGFLAQAVGRELIKFIPGLGSAIAASWAAAYTWSLGEGACVYFGDLMGGKKPDSQKIQAAMAEAFNAAKERFKVGS